MYLVGDAVQRAWIDNGICVASEGRLAFFASKS